MDAVEYLEEKQRMCDKSSCIHCPLGRTYRNSEDSCDVFIRKSRKEAVEIVEKWSKEHPIVKNWQKFQEVFGTAIDPVTATVDWWSAEYKEPKGE